MSVFNPDLESDGWQSTHTVIFILHPNMPFLIDSLRIAINQREIGTHSIQHSILQVERDTQGKLKKLHPPKKKSANASYEAFIVLEIDRHSSPEDLRSLEEVLQTILHEVRIAVSDFPIVTEKVNEISRELDNTTAGIDEEEKEEAKAFLAWLVKDHFTFLGYDEYDFAKDKSGLVVRRVEAVAAARHRAAPAARARARARVGARRHARHGAGGARTLRGGERGAAGGGLSV